MFDPARKQSFLEHSGHIYLLECITCVGCIADIVHIYLQDEWACENLNGKGLFDSI